MRFYLIDEVEKYFYGANVKWAVTEEHYFEKLSKSVILHSVQVLLNLHFCSSDRPPALPCIPHSALEQRRYPLKCSSAVHSCATSPSDFVRSCREEF